MTDEPNQPAQWTSHTIRDIPNQLWDDWSDLVPRKYPRLGDPIIEFIAADLQCRQQDGRSAVTILVDEGYIDRDAIDAMIRDEAVD